MNLKALIPKVVSIICLSNILAPPDDCMFGSIYLNNYDEALEKMGINASGRALTDTQVICYAFDGKLMSYSNWKISYFTPSFLME